MGSFYLLCFQCLVLGGISMLSVGYRIKLADKYNGQRLFFNPQFNVILHQIKTQEEFFFFC